MARDEQFEPLKYRFEQATTLRSPLAELRTGRTERSSLPRSTMTGLPIGPGSAQVLQDWQWTRQFCDRCLQATELADLRQMVVLRDDLAQIWRDRQTQSSERSASPEAGL